MSAFLAIAAEFPSDRNRNPILHDTVNIVVKSPWFPNIAPIIEVGRGPTNEFANYVEI
jgi:hypothetical protein